MSNYLTTKPIFDKSAVKIGYFIEVYGVKDPLQEVKRGVIVYVSETTIQFMDGKTTKHTINVEQIDECEVDIKVSKEIKEPVYVHKLIKEIHTETHPRAGRRMSIELTEDPSIRGKTFDEVIIDGEPYQRGSAFTTKVIKNLSIETLDENKERSLYLTVDKEYSETFDRIKLNGIPYYPLIGSHEKKTDQIVFYNDPSKVHTIKAEPGLMPMFVGDFYAHLPSGDIKVDIEKPIPNFVEEAEKTTNPFEPICKEMQHLVEESKKQEQAEKEDKPNE